MYTPLNAVIVALIYQDNYDTDTPFPTTMTQLFDALTRGLIRRHLVSTHRVPSEYCMPPSLQRTEDISKLPLLVDQQYSNTDNDSPTAVSLPSLHKIKQKASIAAWEAIRPAILNTVTESFAMPKDQLCTYCDVMPASFRCLQCGPSVYSRVGSWQRLLLLSPVVLQ